MSVQFVSVGALRAKMAARDRRAGIAFDRNQLAIFVKDHLPAADSAIGTDGARELSIVILGLKISGALAHRLRAGTVTSGLNLPDEGPAFE